MADIAMRGDQDLSQETIASIVLNGDLSKLSPTQKVQYYQAMCHRLELDPVSQPFSLLKLKGREILYCNRAGVQQLNKLHKISHQVTAREVIEGVYTVFVRAIAADGRYTEASGAICLEDLKGEERANAIMKAESKAKRRASLDLVGLGMEDLRAGLPSTERQVPVGEADQETGEIATVASSEFLIPAGPNKGKKIHEVDPSTLAAHLEYCKERRIHLDYVKALEAYLEGVMGE